MMVHDTDNGDQVDLDRVDLKCHLSQIHSGRNILPREHPPAHAWTEREKSNPPAAVGQVDKLGENIRLLGISTEQVLKVKSIDRRGTALGSFNNKSKRCPQFSPLPSFDGAKNKFQKTTEKFAECFKPPYFILSMITFIVFIHILGNDKLRASLEWCPESWTREPWRLVTYGCVHATAGHLALNSIVALAVGWPLEREQCWWRVVLVWAGGVSAGALGAGALQPHVRVVGASAAVYALLTAHVSNVCLRYGHVPVWWFRPLSVVVLVSSEGCWAALRARVPPALALPAAPPARAHDHVAWAAHALGAAVGIPVAFLVLTGENSSKRYVRVCRALSATLLLAGCVLTAIQYTSKGETH